MDDQPHPEPAPPVAAEPEAADTMDDQPHPEPAPPVAAEPEAADTMDDQPHPEPARSPVVRARLLRPLFLAAEPPAARPESDEDEEEEEVEVEVETEADPDFVPSNGNRSQRDEPINLRARRSMANANDAEAADARDEQPQPNVIDLVEEEEEEAPPLFNSQSHLADVLTEAIGATPLEWLALIIMMLDLKGMAPSSDHLQALHRFIVDMNHGLVNESGREPLDPSADFEMILHVALDSAIN